LVTTAFFDEMFLNEAMAQYWETNGIMYAFPEQAKMGKFERFRKGMDGFAVDSSPDTSKPVIPKKPKYSTGIIYDKGATLLHMLSNTVSPEVLQLGLQKYLKKYKYSNVVDSDLWGEITQAAATKNKKDWDGKPLNVQLLMDPWTKQATYPVLKVSYDDASKQVTYSQEPFIVDAVSKLGPSPYDYKWIIPVFSQTAEGSTFNYFTGADGGNPSVWKRPLNGWQVENAGFAGFFRVWYDDATWQPILNQLQSDREVFDELTRAEFIADAVALRERGSLEWKRVLDLALQLEGETELAPWYAFSKTFDELNSISQSNGFSDGEREKFQVFFALFLILFFYKLPNDRHTGRIKNPELFQLFARKILKNIYEKIAWKNTTDWSQDMLASYITEWACDANLPQCLNDAAEKLNTFARDCEHSKSGTGICNRVSPNVRRTQYCWGTLMNADENNVVGKMYDWFVENSKYFERDADNLLEGQSCTQNADKFNDLIQRTLSGELPAKTLEYLGKHDGTGQRLWEYFKKNTDEIIFGVPSVLEYMNAAMAKWSRSIDIDLVNHFMEDSSLLSEDNKEEISQALSNLEKRIDYITANKQSIVDWLGSNLHRFFE
uniref:Aminopeptidase n=1 Tax=Anisakis simplex TaxID=6269 RepID=A0A0M3K8U2_ANISI